MLDVTVNTIQRWDREGKIQCERTPSGRRRIAESEIRRLQGKAPRPERPRLVLYGRVSSHEQKAKGDLDRQLSRLRASARRRGEIVAEVTEVGSGLNDRRRGLQRVLRMMVEDKCDAVVVEHRDRLTRFGFEYLATFADAQGTEILVMNETTAPEEIEKELVEDMIAIVSSFAGKLYGMRSAKRRKIKAAVEAAVDEE